MGPTDALLPGKRDNDLLNLGGFQTPAFPTSVQECFSSEWNNTIKELEQRISKTAQLTGMANSRQAQAAQKTGLERPTRPTLAETPAHPAPVEPPSKSVEVLKPMEPKSASHTPVQNKPSLQRPAAHKPSGFERVLHAARVVAPLVERLLPLLSPGVATAANAATLLLHHPSQPRIDMQPVEQELDKLDAAQSELGQKLAEQATQLKNASKRIESLEELTEQHHAELEQSLLSMRAKVTVLLRLTVVLLVISLTTVGYMVLHAFKVLP